jgi:hypothetical protein
MLEQILFPQHQLRRQYFTFLVLEYLLSPRYRDIFHRILVEGRVARKDYMTFDFLSFCCFPLASIFPDIIHKGLLALVKRVHDPKFYLSLNRMIYLKL